MRSAAIFALLYLLVVPAARGQSTAAAPAPVPTTAGGAVEVDRIAARIEGDIITESEVRELAQYQKLVQGQADPREKVLEKLIEQWIVRTEAVAALSSRPSEEEVNHFLERLKQRIGSPEQFRARMAEAGLSEDSVRRLLAEQVYLARFLDYKFRPAAQVDPKQIEAYYKNELTAQLTTKGQPVPPLDEVEDRIREILTQREINDRAAKWLDETKPRLHIDLSPGGDGP